MTKHSPEQIITKLRAAEIDLAAVEFDRAEPSIGRDGTAQRANAKMRYEMAA